MSVLRLGRWMGHHSPAFTLETYGHLVDGDLGPALDLRRELGPAGGDRTERPLRTDSESATTHPLTPGCRPLRA
jgi:hypothetical protein